MPAYPIALLSAAKGSEAVRNPAQCGAKADYPALTREAAPMPVSRITQRFVDDLLGAEAPARDEFYWSERMPGFGVKHRAGSGSVSYVIQWRGSAARAIAPAGAGRREPR